MAMFLNCEWECDIPPQCASCGRDMNIVSSPNREFYDCNRCNKEAEEQFKHLEDWIIIGDVWSKKA